MPGKRMALPLAAVALAFALAFATDARAEQGVPIDIPTILPPEGWSFVGPFGRWDQAQLRRGFQVHSEACAGCHSLRHVAYRNLEALGIGFGPEDIKALAASSKVEDGPDENGKMFRRPALPADRIVPPYPNKEAARAANKGMYPPDLSLIVKARKGGREFLYDFLTGYVEAPPGFDLRRGMYYNTAVHGHQTGMAPALAPDLVVFDDGTEASVEQMATDVTAFLTWAADPHMETRKKVGLKVVIFLGLLTIVFIALKREVWAHLHRPSHAR